MSRLILTCFFVVLSFFIPIMASTIAIFPRGNISASGNTMTVDALGNHFNFENGNLGIGPTLPSTALDVSGTASGNSFHINGDISAGTAQFSQTVTASSFSGNGTGFVSSNTVSPGLVVNDDISGSAAISSTKLSGALTDIVDHGLHQVATSNLYDHVVDKIILHAAASSNYLVDGSSLAVSFGTSGAHNIAVGEGLVGFNGTEITVNKSCYLFVEVNMAFENISTSYADDSLYFTIQKNANGAGYINKVSYWTNPYHWGAISSRKRTFNITFSGIIKMESYDSGSDKLRVYMASKDSSDDFYIVNRIINVFEVQI